MIFLAIFTFFLALVSVSASVISKPQGLSPFPDSSPLAQLATRTAPAVNDCDAGYIQDHTDDKSPFIADCEALWHNLYYGTVTIILNGETLQAAQYKSCAIGIVSWDCENDKSLVTPPPTSPAHSVVQGPLADMHRSLFRSASPTCTQPRLETRTSAAHSGGRLHLQSPTANRPTAGWEPSACSTARLCL